MPYLKLNKIILNGKIQNLLKHHIKNQYIELYF
jgi:hypothetical protein